MENIVPRDNRSRPGNNRRRPLSLASSAVSQNSTTPMLLVRCTLLSLLVTMLASGCSPGSPQTGARTDNVPVTDLVPEATRIVQEALGDPDPTIRVNAIEVAATTGLIRLMPQVQALLTDDFVPVRFAAALAVGDTEYAIAKNALNELSRDNNENVRAALLYAKARLGSAESLELLRRMINSPDMSVRANVAMLLGKTDDRSDPTRRALWWALTSRDSDDMVTFQAAESIAMLGDEHIYPKLWTMLISAYADVKIMGIKAMGALAIPEARNALSTMLDDDIWEVRLAAAEQLAILGDTTAQNIVIDTIKKNRTARLDEQQRRRTNVIAALSIGRIATPAVTRFLPPLLRNESKSVRLAAAKAVFLCAARNR